MSAFFSNPSKTLLTDSLPALNATSEMQTQNIAMNVQAQDKNAQNTLDSALAQAQQSAYQSAQQIGDQALAFSGSGVRLEGTPMQVLNKSRELAIQSVNNIAKQGLNSANLQLTNAAITANQGRAALLGNVTRYGTDIAQSDIANQQQRLQQAGQFAQTIASLALGGGGAGGIDPFLNGGTGAPATPGYPIGNP